MSKLSLESLEKSEVKVTLVQAVPVRQYARAAGILAKTDRIDAKVLAAFGSAMQPQPTSPLSAEQKRLRQHKNSPLSAESVYAPQRSCLRNCPSLANSIVAKLPRSPAWRHLHGRTLRRPLQSDPVELLPTSAHQRQTAQTGPHRAPLEINTV